MKIRFGISSMELKWLESYLFNREQQYSVNNNNNNNNNSLFTLTTKRHIYMASDKLQ